VRLVVALLGMLAAAQAFAAYDANGVALGASETDIKKRFPSAHCKALEWQSRAADRRCDDAKISFGGVSARITFYLRKDAVQGFDVRFETKQLEPVMKQLRQRYGAPVSEVKDPIGAGDKPVKELYKVLWEAGKDRAVLTAQLDKPRASLLVSRGDFEDEIYRVR
jgi:hypothetical protein